MERNDRRYIVSVHKPPYVKKADKEAESEKDIKVKKGKKAAESGEDEDDDDDDKPTVKIKKSKPKKKEQEPEGSGFPDDVHVFAPTSSIVKSALCRKHSRVYLRQLKRYKLWALMSKYPRSKK